MNKKRNPLMVGGEAIHLDAPGLKITNQGRKLVARWFADREAIRSGYRPKTVRLNYDLAKKAEIEKMAARCRKLWAEMLDWLRDLGLAHRKKGGQIYFVEMQGFIKIGYTKNWRHRLIYFQSSSPFEAKLLHICPATRGEETAAHKRFAHLRERGEWFRSAPELLGYISALQ